MKLFKKTKQTPIRQPRLMPGQEDYAFRRSRTLTGSTSAAVTSSAEARSQLKTPRLQVHELQQQRARVLKLLGVLLFASIAVAFLLFNYISSIPVLYLQPQGAQARPDTDNYRKSIDSYFASQPFERFGFLLDNKRLANFLRAQHGEIAELTVEKQWYGGNPEFIINFRKPILVWQAGDQRMYVDDQGIAFNYDHFGTPLVSVTDQSGISPGIGSSVASKRFLQFLGKLVGAVNTGGKGAVEAIVIPPSTREIDLRLKGRGYPIKTHIDRDPLQQAEDILNALAYFDERKITPQYIDVRVSGKAYYK